MKAAQPSAPSWVVVGKITRAHGVKGEVGILPLSVTPDRFAPGSRLALDDGGRRWVTVRASRPHHQRLLVAFEETPDRTAAEALQGEYLFVPVEALPPLPEGEYWPHQLLGCEVRTREGRSLGTLRDVIHSPANDVWVAQGPEGETLVPALKDVVISVDLEARLILVREIPGLTAP